MRHGALHQALLLALAVACSMMSPGTAQAASATDGTAEPFSLGVVEVIADAPDDHSHGVAQLTLDELRTWQREDLAQALDLLPSVSLQNLGQRRERLIALRGFNSRQVPLFIDGVPVYVPYDGNVDLSRFGVDYVSEINVSGGLASVLYGPNILGGAINVVSRKPDQPLQVAFRLGLENGEGVDSLVRRASADIGGLRGRIYYQVSASWTDAEGYTLPDDFVPTAAEDGGARENAASNDRLVNAKLGWTGDDAEYALAVHSQQGEKQVPPYAGSAPRVAARFWRWPFWDKQGIYLTGRNTLSERASLRWRVYRDTFNNSLSSFDDANFNSFTRPYAFNGSEYDDYTWGGNADLELRWTDAQISRAAAHLKQDIHREVDNITAPQERYEDRSYALAVEHEWKLSDALSLTPGYAWTKQQGRQAENNVNGSLVPFAVGSADAHNGQLVLDWRSEAGWEWTAGISRKTRFPTIKDRFSFRLGAAIPNPDLGPETAVHVEAGVRRETDKLDFALTVFSADVEDAIENVVVDASLCTAPNPTCFQQRNVGEQRNRGVEISARLRPSDAWQILAQTSFLDRDNLSNPQIRSTDTPEFKYRLGVNWQLAERWALDGEIQREALRYSTSDGARVAQAFTLANAYLRFALDEQWRISAGVRNIADELYAYSEGFYEPGRTGLLQLDYRY